MSLSDLSAIGSFVSGVGVLISLLLLVFQLRQVTAQIRQAERNQQAAIHQDRYARVFEANLAVTEPTLADAVAKGMSGAHDMSRTEIWQFRAWTFARFQISENTFFQHQDGLLSDEIFAAFLNGFANAFGLPSVRLVWAWAKPAHAAEFVAFVDAIIAETPLAAAVDLVGIWNQGLSAELASAS